MSADTGVILAAAGEGSRFGEKKQFLELEGRPLVHWCLDALSAVEDVSRIVLILPRLDLKAGRVLLESWRKSSQERSKTSSSRPRELNLTGIEGGKRRQESVVNGLRFLRGTVRLVLVHDAARPLLTPDDARNVLKAVRSHGAAAIGTPSTDSVKRVVDHQIVESLSRDEIWTVQTPQGAFLEELLGAYEKGGQDELTDEASALKACGFPVAVVQGSPDNMKITLPEDAQRVEELLRLRGCSPAE